ncbi:VPLPA-CTERM sorting domain-containing protein [Methylophilus aquaticus]|uniref:VPLPA-CTERM sorting domain-containing protein n=1 Tax=Methylophilus aquaticus TaxID=1971610 RepID=A0ABT9JSR5_9PROT|nr:VPLPA-CTERM sorting domain-containing protein [Methylophilus aquaticus]MDP8567575.1 VPLPA-CTERM sorting domain-containing protein [Methylophilus aquaticus]
MKFVNWITLAGLTISMHANATLLTIVNNVVYGAKNIEINGVLYDAEFGHGYLANNSVFDNYDKGKAEVVGQALINQVFSQIKLNNGEYLNGCSAYDAWCSAYTFMDTSTDEGFLGAYTNGHIEWEEGFNSAIRDKFSYIFSTSNGSSYITTIQWSLAGAQARSASSPSSIPIPAAAWLFGTGLFGLAYIKRRRMDYSSL